MLKLAFSDDIGIKINYEGTIGLEDYEIRSDLQRTCIIYDPAENKETMGRCRRT